MAKAKADSNGHWRNRIVGSDVVAADQLLANPYNWRIHPKHQQEALAASLNGVGWVQEIVVNQRSGHVIDGHLRAALAISRGEMVPVKYVDLSDDEERLVLATLDPLAALAATDRDMLEDILSGLRETELVQDDEALDKLLHEVAAGANVAYGEYAGQPDPGPQIDRAEELREKWQTACGQVWEAPSKTVPGRAHRVMCGDSTSAADVARLMAGEKAGMGFSDPPYSKDYASRGEKGDVAKTGDFRSLIAAIAGEYRNIGAWYVKLPWYDAAAVLDVLNPSHFIVWAKQGFCLGGGDFRPQHEVLLYRRNHGPCHAGADVGDVWTFPVPFRGRMQHVAETPAALIAQAIGFSSNPGDVVEDLFAGSGTTLIAAEQTGRIGYGMEIEPKYVAVTLQRLRDLGLEPYLADGA